jgi:hypothetical protein
VYSVPEEHESGRRRARKRIRVYLLGPACVVLALIIAGCGCDTECKINILHAAEGTTVLAGAGLTYCSAHPTSGNRPKALANSGK